MSLPNERTEPQLHYARLGDGFWFWIHDDEHSRWEDDDLHTPKWLPTNERTKRTTYEGFLGARTTRAGSLELVDDGRNGWSWTCSLSKAKTANYALVEWHW